MSLPTRSIIPGKPRQGLTGDVCTASPVVPTLTYHSTFPRWLCYCHVPQSCDSLPRYETTHVFGRSLLRSIFTVTRRQLLEKFRVEKDKLVPEKRTLILTHFPK